MKPSLHAAGGLTNEDRSFLEAGVLDVVLTPTELAVLRLALDGRPHAEVLAAAGLESAAFEEIFGRLIAKIGRAARLARLARDRVAP